MSSRNSRIVLFSNLNHREKNWLTAKNSNKIHASRSPRNRIHKYSRISRTNNWHQNDRDWARTRNKTSKKKFSIQQDNFLSNGGRSDRTKNSTKLHSIFTVLLTLNEEEKVTGHWSRKESQNLHTCLPFTKFSRALDIATSGNQTRNSRFNHRSVFEIKEIAKRQI